MAEITRAPTTAAEAEAQLASGAIKPTGGASPARPADPTDKASDNRVPSNDGSETPADPGLVIPRGLMFKLKGKGDAEAEATLIDGRVVTLKVPEVATQFTQARILATAMPQVSGAYPQELKYQVQALMHVSAIDGKKVIRPQDFVEAQKLMNELGEEGVNVVTAAYVNHYVTREIPLPL